MRKIYFAGKFNKTKEHNLTLEQSLINDYRSKILGNSEALTYYQDRLVVNDKFLYMGPFYCEKASNGDYTSTDCDVVINAEYDAIKNSDMFVVVLGESFSVGSIVELGWALDMNKEIVILYQEEKSDYKIKSEYWFAIANALRKSNQITVRKYQKYAQICSIINSILN